MKAPFNILVPIVLASALLGMSPASSGESDPEGVIKYRQGVMKAQAGYMAAMAQIVRGKVDYGTHLAGHAKALHRLAQSVPELFPEGSDFGETEAKEKIWEEFDKFKTAAQKAEKAAAELAEAAASGDGKLIGAKFKATGESCKGCHDTYREKRE